MRASLIKVGCWSKYKGTLISFSEVCFDNHHKKENGLAFAGCVLTIPMKEN